MLSSNVFFVHVLNSPLGVRENSAEFPNSPFFLDNSGADDIGYYYDGEFGGTRVNAHYRVKEFYKVIDYSPSISNPTVDIIGFERMPYEGSQRVLFFKNGSMSFLDNINGSDVSTGYDIVYNYTDSYSTSDFEPMKASIIDESGTSYIYVAGRNKTTNGISLLRFLSNKTAQNITEVYRYNPPIPSNFTYTGCTVMDLKPEGPGAFHITGKFVNNSENFPFIYYLEYDGSNFNDITKLDSSDTFYLNFDDMVNKYYPSPGFVAVTNKNLVKISAGLNAIDYIVDLPQDIPLTSQYTSFSTYKTTGYFSNASDTSHFFTYNMQGTDLFPRSFIAHVNNTGSFNTNVFETEGPGLLNEVTDFDTIWSITPDFSDGMLIGIIDEFDKRWNQFSITADTVGLFNFYVPISIIEVAGGVEVWMSNRDKLYFIFFTDDLDALYDIGNSRVNQVTADYIKVYHSKASENFEFEVSGYIERNPNNDSEIVQVGVIPVLATAGDMFSIDSVIEFTGSSSLRGVVVNPITNFQGYGNRFIDFQIRCECDFAPFSSNALPTNISLTSANIEFKFVTYEIYQNGSFTQKSMDSADEVKNRFFDYDYELETAITIQDSHLLDELDFFAGGIEFDPYNVVFQNASTSVLISDKITNDTLFSNTKVLFSDPLGVNIPAKWEFWLDYFGIDGFGLEFNLVDTFINGTEVNTEFIRILSPSAEIVVKDFADVILLNTTVNKYDNGTYIKLGLDVATILIQNRYNFTVYFYLTKAGKEIYYQIPPDTAIILRLALGEYNYIVTDLAGNELINKQIEFEQGESSFAISFGFTEIQPGDTIYTNNFNIVLLLMIFGFIIGITLFIGFRLQNVRFRQLNINNPMKLKRNKPKKNKPRTSKITRISKSNIERETRRKN